MAGRENVEGIISIGVLLKVQSADVPDCITSQRSISPPYPSTFTYNMSQGCCKKEWAASHHLASLTPEITTQKLY